MSGDYAIAPIEGVAPEITEAWLRQSMATRFMARVPGMEREEANTHVEATWETEWPDYSKPRTLAMALEVVDDALSYWEE